MKRDFYRRCIYIYKKLERTFYEKFLPLVYSENYIRNYINWLQEHKKVNIYRTSSKKIVLFYPPPVIIKKDPVQKPLRLKKVINKLKHLWNLPLDKKIQIAEDVIKTLFRTSNNLAVAFSGGKDSLVVLHMVRQYNPNIPVVFINTGVEFPETVNYVYEIAKKWNLNFFEVKPKVNFWKLCDEKGLPVAGRGNTTFMRKLSIEANVKLSNACCQLMKEKPAKKFYEENNIEGVMVGCRVSESIMRRFNFADFGAIRYSSTYNILVAWPLYAFLDEDIEEYIRKYNLPLNPLYKMGYKRVGCWPCLQDLFFPDSRLFILKEKHPNMFKTIERKFGDKIARLLTAWANLEDVELKKEDIHEFYTPCFIDEIRRYKRKQKK